MFNYISIYIQKLKLILYWFIAHSIFTHYTQWHIQYLFLNVNTYDSKNDNLFEIKFMKKQQPKIQFFK